ncbi:hypothetical protein [Sutterella sp.]|uniref:hypothetical protein n=1 Tax=Sutterella sp. TaxID=1981025 RepID=UPI0026DFCA78|nr:hypothetical protein [Sutterella sp.]MDO5530692.1 hypothetical protein [Sutterella sp.]
MKNSRILQALFVAAAVPCILAGCAHPQLVDMGAPEPQIVEYLGAPHARVALPDGRTRLVYSGQGAAQEVWWMTLDAEGRLEKLENVLDREHFALIKPGVSTEADVWNLFGKCAQEYEFHLSNQHAWMYRFKDEGMFDMACWVQFDVNGVVTEVGYTLDPWKDRDSFLMSI